jgi:hypothetical protein
LLFLLPSVGGRVNVVAASGLLTRVHEISDGVEARRKGWDYVLLGFLLAANIIIIYRQAWRRHNQALTEFFRQEIERVQSERAAGQ